MKTLAAVFLCVSLTPPCAARAAEPVDTVQGIIQSQITAFLNDDAKTAYSFASPTIRGKFPTEDAFFDMVKKGYAPVYRPGNFAFGRAKVADGMVVQEVLISGPDGKVSLGHSWESAALTPFKLVDGTVPRAADQVVLDRELASRTGLKVVKRAILAARP